MHKFNKMAAGLKDAVVLAISKDLPFAHARFCTTEGIENVVPVDFRYSDFDEAMVYAWSMVRLQVCWRVR